MHVLAITTQEQNEILQEFKIEPSALKEKIELIQIWKQQLNLPEITDDFIRRMLIRNKFRLELTQIKIKNYFTLRRHHRDLVAGFERIVPSELSSIYIPIPQVSQKVERIVIMKLIETNPELYNFQNFLKLVLATIELGMHYDDSVGVRYIIDLEGFTFRHFMQWNPVVLHKIYILTEKAYSWRVLEITFINAPDFIGKVLAMIKLILPTKIYERLHVLNSSEKLLDFFSEECLPAEYGGTCSNLKDLLTQWDEIFKNHHDFFVTNYKKIFNKKIQFYTEASCLYGPNGSFRNISLD